MEFFDKKQDVINLQLTRYGRQLLSIGEFRPAYYAFSDDGIIYDTRWVSGSTDPEEQWLVEPRIQEETPRLETVNSKIGTERTVFNTADLSSYALEKNIVDLFNIGNDFQDLADLEEYKAGKLKLDPDFAESEKLLTHLLGTKRYFNNKAPAWNVIYYNGVISSSANSYQQNGLSIVIPQLETVLRDRVFRVPEDLNIFEVEPSLQAISEMDLGQIDGPILGTLDDSFTGQDGTEVFAHQEALEELISDTPLASGSIVVEKDYIFASFEEAHVDFENENFLLEVYAITETGGQQSFEKMVFLEHSDLDKTLQGDAAVEDVFDIQVDEEVDRGLACSKINNERKLKTKNIYLTGIYECELPAIKGRPVGSSYDLPPVDTGDVC
jgi:hypothetical protein